MKKYYSLVVENREASITIYGDITSWEWFDSDVSSYTLSKEIEGLDVDIINIYINSYGGEVAEGLAIYNNLKRHKAKIKTYDDGFACSSASIIFMAGDERIMSNSSLLFIHNAWTYASGNANQLRKEADDLDVITQASINAYLNHVNVTEDELKEMLDIETWLTPAQALEMGFATSVVNDGLGKNPSQSVKKSLAEIIFNHQKENIQQAKPNTDPEPEPKESKFERFIKNQIKNEEEKK